MNLKEVITGVMNDRGSKPISVKEFMAALEKTGRGGDTKLVHVTDRELEILKQMGSGKKNPDTGLMEFRGEGGGQGGPGDPGDPSGAGGTGGGSDSGGGPAGVGIGGDRPGEGIGRGAGVGVGRGGGPSAADLGADTTGGAFGTDTGTSNPTGAGSRGVAASHSDPIGGVAQGGKRGAANRSIAKAINAMLSVTPLGPINALGMQMGEDDEVGLAGMARGFGEGLGAVTGVGAGEVGSSAPNDPTAADRQLPPDAAPPPPGLTRPGELAPPDFLGIQQAMTPLQQRSLVATRGVSGDEGGFRSSEAQDFYKNLLQRDIITDTGGIAEGAQILPIEAQYMQDIMGLNATPDVDIERFARALQGLPLDEPVAPEAKDPREPVPESNFFIDQGFL